MKHIKGFFRSMYKSCQWYGPIVVPIALLSLFLDSQTAWAIGIVLIFCMFASIKDDDMNV